MVSLGKNSALLERFANNIREDENDSGSNHLYSVAALTNAAGAVVERYRYDTYGNRTVLAPDGVTPRAVSSYNQQVGFTGRYEDKETKLWYFRARYYSGTLGRFIGRDPLGYVDGDNLYRAYYVPNALDPSGRYEIDVHYYLTYYIGKHNPCLSDDEAREIADADQRVDEDPNTTPNLGVSARQRQVNRQFHHLGDQDTTDDDGSPTTYLMKQWLAAAPMTFSSSSSKCNGANLGIFLHHLQDTFAHDGFTNSLYGHGGAGHKPDKTATDIAKAELMARATWEAIINYSRICNPCCYKEKIEGKEEALYQTMASDLAKFFVVPAGGFWNGIDNDQLQNRAKILGIPGRPDPIPTPPSPSPRQNLPRHTDLRGGTMFGSGGG